MNRLARTMSIVFYFHAGMATGYFGENLIHGGNWEIWIGIATVAGLIGIFLDERFE